MFNWKDQKKPVIAMSPMADMTDLPFCLVAKDLGAEIMFREMVSSEALVRGSEKTFNMAAFDERERPIIQQIFGGDSKIMAEAARLIEERYHPDGIDVNMGCPVYKITSNFNGASLMRDPKKASEIVSAVKSAISVPLSVKIRLGWSEKTEALDFVKYLEDAGADLISVHGRTRAQAYGGEADWEMIGRVKKQVSVPVLANDDIHKPEQVPDALCITGCDGVLIGRGCLGNPWFFRHAREVLETGSVQTPVSLKERFEVCMRHARFHVEYYGDHGVVTFRKHLSWYLKGIPGVKEMRTKIMQVKELDELESLLRDFLVG